MSATGFQTAPVEPPACTSRIGGPAPRSVTTTSPARKVRTWRTVAAASGGEQPAEQAVGGRGEPDDVAVQPGDEQRALQPAEHHRRDVVRTAEQAQAALGAALLHDA